MGSSRLMLLLLLYFGSGFGEVKCGSCLVESNTWTDPEFAGRCDWARGQRRELALGLPI